MVSGGQDLTQVRTRNGAAHSDVDVRREPSLRLDSAEILHVIAEVSAQVLNEPVEQCGEVQRVSCGALVVVAGRIGGVGVLNRLAGVAMPMA